MSIFSTSKTTKTSEPWHSNFEYYFFSTHLFIFINALKNVYKCIQKFQNYNKQNKISKNSYLCQKVHISKYYTDQKMYIFIFFEFVGINIKFKCIQFN